MSSLTGKFLVARPLLHDPNFVQTVVLLLHHSTKAAFGLVVNRPAEVKELPFPVFSGGPCESQGLLLLHGHAEWMKESADLPESEVAPGIFLGDASCLQRLSEPDPELVFRFRMFSGNSGWGPGQLEAELVAGVWAVIPATGELLFDTPIDDLWNRLSPPNIPQPSAN